MSRVLKARELRRAMELYAQTVTDESQMQEIAGLYPAWAPGQNYKNKAILRYGVNALGDPQLWQVIGDHPSQAQYPPDVDITHYKRLGIAEGGYTIWTQPLGAEDAYQLGDRVSYNDTVWECTSVDAGGNNTWTPGVYGWTEVTS